MKEYFLHTLLFLKKQFVNKIYICFLVLLPLCLCIAEHFLSKADTSASIPVGYYFDFDDTELEAELTERQTELETLQKDIKGYESVINQYAADEKRIDREIKAMQEELKKQQTPPTATGSYMWPSTSCYVVTSKYGWRTISLYGTAKFHAGIDIGAAMGTAIVASDGGNVIVSTYDGGYGNYVMINHGDGRSTLYGHMSSRAVSVGQTVTKGQVIGYVGSTGNSTGPHIHFEIRVNGGTVNPLKYFSGYTVA